LPVIVLKEFFNRIYPIEDEVLNLYLEYWKSYDAQKKEIITAPGKTEKYLYFLTEGVQKVYFHNNGKDHVVAFVYAPSFSGVFESFFAQQPSNYFLETVTPCHFLRIHYESHIQMLEEHPSIERFFRKALELVVSGLSQRHYELMAYDIETRFKVFMKRSPHLLHLVPQKDIASYLNMDASNFSKLINKYMI